MKKFWVIFFSILVVCVIGISMIFIFSTQETIKISADVMYVNIGEEFELTLDHKNANDSTTIEVSSSDSSIVSFDNGLCIARAGGVARITFTTSNSRYKNLYCDVMVGDGSEANPFYISSAEQFAEVATNENVASNLCYKLVNDIDLKDYNDGYWTPIKSFTGKLDGNGYTIKNMYIDSENANVATNAGLFEILEAGSSVVNVKFEACDIVGEFDNVGTIAGVNYGVIERVEVKDTTLDVNANYIGGLVGINATTDNTITNKRCVATIIKSSANVIMGQSKEVTKDGEIVYTNTGITGLIGGIAGQNIGGTISNTYSVGKVVLGSANIVYGGLVGDNQYTISSVMDEANYSYVACGKVENSYSAIALFSNKVNNFSNEKIGGIVGINTDIIEEINDNGVTLKYSSNNLVGLYYDSSKLNYSNSQNVKVFDGVGVNLLTNTQNEAVNDEETVGYVFGYTTNSMKIASNFKTVGTYNQIYDVNGKLLTTQKQISNWDFNNVWAMNGSLNNGYPTLTYLYIEGEQNITTNSSYVILPSYELTITQGKFDANDNTYKYAEDLINIIVKDSNGEVIKESTSSAITMSIPEGYRVNTTNTGIAITDLDSNLYYTVTFEVEDEDFKYNSIAIDKNLSANGGVVKTDGEVNIWFRNTTHTLEFISASTDDTIKTYTVSEGTSLTSYINNIKNRYSGYDYVRFSTNANGTGTYSVSSKMPSKDLTLYVIYGDYDDKTSDDIYDKDYDTDKDEDKNYDDDDDTYEIYNVETWNKYVVSYGDDEDVTFVQTKSFTITSEFEAAEVLAGNYDGNGYTITVKGSLNDFALFDTVEDSATIYDLQVKYTSANVKSLLNDEYFGAIANVSYGNIEDCVVSGTINFDDEIEKAVGGIVGHMVNGTVIDCTNAAKISVTTQIVAGIVGSMKKGTVSDCSNTGAIINESDDIYNYDILDHGTIISAGIVGYMYNKTTKNVENNTNSAKITSEVAGANDGGNSAGIVGYMTYGTVNENTNNGNIEADYQAGGIVAYMCGGKVSNNRNTGDIMAETDIRNTNVSAGGIVGKVHNSGTISGNIHSKGEVIAHADEDSTSQAYAGGIIGSMFYGGKATNNELSGAVTISATAYYAFACGGCGRNMDATFSGCDYASNWQRVCNNYINCTGTTTYMNYDVYKG